MISVEEIEKSLFNGSFQNHSVRIPRFTARPVSSFRFDPPVSPRIPPKLDLPSVEPYESAFAELETVPPLLVQLKPLLTAPPPAPVVTGTATTFHHRLQELLLSETVTPTTPPPAYVPGVHFVHDLSLTPPPAPALTPCAAFAALTIPCSPAAAARAYPYPSLHAWQSHFVSSLVPRLGAGYVGVVASLPTGSGKSLPLELLALRATLAFRRKALVVCPLVSLVHEKARDLGRLCTTLGGGVEVHEIHSARPLPPLQPYNKPEIFVCTPEKALSLLLHLSRPAPAPASAPPPIAGLAFAGVDEVHTLGGEGSRSATLELLITALRTVLQRNSATVPGGTVLYGASATLPNAQEVAQWMGGQEEGCAYVSSEVVSKVFRSVLHGNVLVDGAGLPRRHQPLHPSGATPNPFQAFMYVLCLGIVPDGSIPDFPFYGQCTGRTIVFCPTKRATISTANRIASNLSSYLPTHALPTPTRRALAARLAAADAGEASDAALAGVGVHHSGLGNRARALSEAAFLSGDISIICATPTLSTGVNLPAKAVIIAAPWLGGGDLLPDTKYIQMIGRAGRMAPGFCGEATLTLPADNQPPSNQLISLPRGLKHEEAASTAHRLVAGAQPKPVLSEMICASTTMLLDFVLYLAALDACDLSSQSSILATLQNSFAALQATRLGGPLSPEKILETSALLSSCLATLPTQELRAAVVASRLPARTFTSLIGALNALPGISDLGLLSVAVAPSHRIVLTGSGADIKWRFISEFSTRPDVCALAGRSSDVLALLCTQIAMRRQLPSHELLAFEFTLTALALQEVIRGESITNVAKMVDLGVGDLQNMLTQAATRCTCISRGLEHLSGYNAVAGLFADLSRQLGAGTTRSATQLLSLPRITPSRARKLVQAGFDIPLLALSTPEDVLEVLPNLGLQVAKMVINAAVTKANERVADLFDDASSDDDIPLPLPLPLPQLPPPPLPLPLPPPLPPLPLPPLPPPPKQ